MKTFTKQLGNQEFLCNKETGKWVLLKKGQSINKELSDYLIQERYHRPTDTNLIVLNSTTNCNMDCSYCLVGDNKKTHESMSLETGIKVVNEAFNLKQKKVHIVFHGSEPLTNLPLIEKLTNYAISKGFNKKISFSIQTNGTLIDETVLDLFKKNDIKISLSLDGLRKHQDATRCYVNGKSTYNVVISKINPIRKLQGGISVNTVINSTNVNDLELIVKDFSKKGIDYLMFSFINRSGNGLINNYLMPSMKDVGDNMVKVFDFVIDSLINNRPVTKVRNLSSILNKLFVGSFSDTCLYCGNGYNHPLIGVDLNGDVYPCDFFFGTKRFLMGNILKESLNDILLKDNIRTTRSIKNVENCAECNYQRFCGGGCLGDPSSNYGCKSPDYCQVYYQLISYVIEKIPFLHQNNLLRAILSWNL